MNLFYVTRKKKVSVGVEYIANTVEYSDASVHSISSAMYGKKGNLLIHYLLSVYHSLD